MKQRMIVFDVGGVLRRIMLPGSPERNWDAIRDLYATLMHSPDWRVAIVTSVPEERTNVEVEDDIKRIVPCLPDDLIILRGTEEKGDAYRQLNPDIVVDDRDRWLSQAMYQGIVALKML